MESTSLILFCSRTPRLAGAAIEVPVPAGRDADGAAKALVVPGRAAVG